MNQEPNHQIVIQAEDINFSLFVGMIKLEVLAGSIEEINNYLIQTAKNLLDLSKREVMNLSNTKQNLHKEQRETKLYMLPQLN